MKKKFFAYLLFFISLIAAFSILVSADQHRYHDEVELLNSSQADYPENTPPSIETCILIALSIGLAAAVITVLILRSQLKSVKSARDASGYVMHDSFALTESRDIFLYSTISKTARSQSSSDSRSRSGGRSGKF